jgi:hypothetical protein
MGCTADPWRDSETWFHGVPGHHVALHASTGQTADPVVADLSLQLSHCVQPHPGSGGAVRQRIPGSACLLLLGQARAIHRCADVDGMHASLSLAWLQTAQAERSMHRPAVRSARSRRYAPRASSDRGARERARQPSSDCRSAKKSPI